MNKVVIELDEKYREISTAIRSWKIQIYGIPSIKEATLFGKPISDVLGSLSAEWFGSESDVSIVKVIERIHSADEIKFVESKKKYWRLKPECNYGSDNDKFSKGTFNNGEFNWIHDEWSFSDNYGEKLTTSEFKQALIDTHCPIPFEFWEAVEV